MAIQYFKIAGKVGTFVMFDDTTSQAQIVIKTELQDQKAALITRIQQNPRPDNATLLEWAKHNYPYVNHDAEEAELARINEILDAIRNL
jgi:hypothetical protein